jgi:hypothetical protein
MYGEILLFAVVAGAIMVFMVFARSRARGVLPASRAASDPQEPRVPRSPLVVPPPPPRPDDPRKLRMSRNQAILLRRDFPPRQESLSHWGGVPIVPRGFTWPFYQDELGHDRTLHHILQVDCSTIPEQGRLGLLPDRGQLYVFLDLDWGNHWKWSVRFEPGDASDFAPARVPDSLPPAYAYRDTWAWPQRDEDWPRLLPSWSVDPVLLTGEARPHLVDEESEELDFWPGTIPLETRLAEIPDAIVPTRYFENRYHEGVLVRPFLGFPHDWQAVRILLGHCARQADRGHLDRHVKRGDLSESEAIERLARLRQAVDAWSLQAASNDPWAPLSQAESDAVWQVVLDHQDVALFGLGEAVNESVDATLAGSASATEVLPAEALELVRSHHALASRDDDGRLHFHGNVGRMLCPPSFVQGDAAGRIGEWLLLLELAESRPIGHHFAEGVYQFWIRPADLAARRFDLVELTASAY